MARPYSLDLRERVVGSVERGGLSRRQAAVRFGVAASTVTKWLQRVRRSGSVSPGKMGGHRPTKLSGAWRSWLLDRCRGGEFTPRGLSPSWPRGACRSTTARYGCSFALRS
jgi:transposase